MTYGLSRRWLLAALFLGFGTPLSALAQDFDLALSGGDSPDPAIAGAGPGNLTTTFTLSRTGTLDATGVAVSVTPTLPAGVTIDSVVPSTGSYVGTTWTVGDWAATANGIDETLIITMTVDSSASVCTACISIAATASATNGPDTVPGNDTATETTDIARQFDLALTGGDSPDPAVQGAGAGNLTTTFTLSRSGPSDAEGVEVLVTPGILPTGVTIDSVVPSVGSWDNVTMIWTVGDWAASANGIDETLTITLTVDNTASDCVDCISIEATASAVSGTDTDLANDTWTETTSIASEVSFALTVDCEPDAVIAGSGAGNMSCVISLAQNGPSDASGVAVNLTLPAGVTVDSADTTTAPGTSFTSPTWTIGDAPDGYSAFITLTMTADETATGDLTVVAAVTANEEITNGPVSDSDVVAAEAASDAPTTFMTTIGFTNGYPGEVTVMISCNNGSPLEQDFEISAGTPVNFVVDLLDFVAPDVDCTVTLEAVDDGYVGSFLANGVDTGDACYFASEPEAGEAPFDGTAARMNTCAITAEPVESEFGVDKLWLFEGDAIVGVAADIDVWCEPASTTTGPVYGTVSGSFYAEGDDEFSLFFYPHWNGETTCYAAEGDLDSAVESDGGCLGGTDFVVGDEEKGCTITNTVFFEGIPTLSQYGLAVMALLMLGLGFVGFRRFV